MSVAYGPKGDTLGHFREVSQFQAMNSVFLVTSFFLTLVFDTEERGERIAAEKQQLHLLSVECWENGLLCTHKRLKKTLSSCVYRTANRIENGVIYRKKEIFLEHVCLGCLDIPHLCHQIRDRLNRTFAHKHS